MITSVIKVPYIKDFGKYETFFFLFDMSIPVANAAVSGVHNRLVSCLGMVLALLLGLRGSTGDLEASYWSLLPLTANGCEKISLRGHGAEHQFSIQNVRSWAWIPPHPSHGPYWWLLLTSDSYRDRCNQYNASSWPGGLVWSRKTVLISSPGMISSDGAHRRSPCWSLEPTRQKGKKRFIFPSTVPNLHGGYHMRSCC